MSDDGARAALLGAAALAAPSIGEALAAAQAAGVDRLEARWLLAHLLQRPRSWLVAHADETLDSGAVSRWRSALARRCAGEPLAYLVGEQPFHGLNLRVTPDVLVPRPDTEVLVEWAIERLADSNGAAMVDLGTGSGAVALAVKQARPSVWVVATDISEPALAVARDNAARLGLGVAFVAGDWWSALDGRRFDVAASNPPYIAADDPHLPALRHEPLGALASGADGLSALRDIVAGAAAGLVPGGWLLLEHGHTQAPAVQGLLAAAGFGAIETRLDSAGSTRCTGGCRPAQMR